MKILGIDPGYAIIGYGVIDYHGRQSRPLEYGTIITDKETGFNQRLEEIYACCTGILSKWKPEEVAIEKLYFNSNQKTAIKVAQARGVILLAVQQAGIPIYEYTPLQAKASVTGYGQAEKPQVMEMVRRMLGLKEIPKPDDAADALAIAICHGQTGGTAIKRLIKATEKNQ